MKNIIKVPKLLHEVHGEHAFIRDIVFAHGLAIVATFIVLLLAGGTLFWWQQVLLGILTYDLVGGVVANFSLSTSSFYATSEKRRKGFLLLHLLQPTLLVLVFTEYWPTIVGISSFILLSSVVVNAMRSGHGQIMVGALLSITGILLLQLPALAVDTTLAFLLTVFLLKLPLAWAVRWYELEH